MGKKDVYWELKRNPKDVRFAMLCRAAELFGFRFRGAREVTKYTLGLVCEKC